MNDDKLLYIYTVGKKADLSAIQVSEYRPFFETKAWQSQWFNWPTNTWGLFQALFYYATFLLLAAEFWCMAHAGYTQCSAFVPSPFNAFTDDE